MPKLDKADKVEKTNPRESLTFKNPLKDLELGKSLKLDLKATEVVARDEGDQSITLTTPNGYTFKIPEAAWMDLIECELLVDETK